MDAPRFLDLSDRLIRTVKSGAGLGLDLGAAECRSAVSRAYYTVFHVASEYLEELGFILAERGPCHKALQFALKSSAHGAIVAIASQLDLLYTERLSADYDLNRPRTENPNQAEALCQQARMTLHMISVVRSGKVTPPINVEKVFNAIAAKKQLEDWGKYVLRKEVEDL